MPDRSPILRSAIGLLLLASVATCAYAISTFEFRWIDLDVYRWGGTHVLDASDLNDMRHPTLGMPFTYTPFAALVFLVLAPMSALIPPTWTLLSVAALARTCWLLAHRRGAWLGGMPTVWPAAAILSFVLATQPGTNTLRLGQVGFILLWLTCEDLLGTRRRMQGTLVGLATAIKLTPGAYILLLLVVGRMRAALVSMLVMLATIAGAWRVLPTESASYWRHLGPDVTTVGPVTAADHWSINGTIWRVAGSGGDDVVWPVCALATMGASLALARRWWRAERPAGAIGLVGLGSVLASPFSWSHHWILVTPLFVALLAEAASNRHSRRFGLVIAATYALLVTGVWWHAPRRLLDLVTSADTTEALASNSYLLIAASLFTLAWLLRPSFAQPTDVAVERDVDLALGTDAVRTGEAAATTP